MIFYPGLHQPSDAHRFKRAFVSVNRVRERKKAVGAKAWIMDSASFTEIEKYGCYRHDVDHYSGVINRWAAPGSGLVCAVAQDYMCEPFILGRTGLSVVEHQRLTIERYDALLSLVAGTYLMPVLQGFAIAEYLDHIDQYGSRLAQGAYVGVGSVCKRNINIQQIEVILSAIRNKRPDLRLHGFGVKTTSLSSGIVRDCLFSADSMAWSYAARKQGRNANDWREAAAFAERIESMPVQEGWDF